jgi:hypothetical protein
MYGRSWLMASTLKGFLEVEDVNGRDAMDDYDSWRGQTNANLKGALGRFEFECLGQQITTGVHRSSAA